MAGIEVVALAGTALFQDAGRAHADSGVPVSGAFDRFAHRAASALVGGSPQDATLEVVGALGLLSHERLTCAVTGVAQVRLQGAPMSSWTALEVPAGGRIEVVAPGRGYVSVAGGFRPEPVLGSRSTCLMGPIGPAPVAVGDLLPVADLLGTAPTAGDFVVPPARGAALRVLPGPHLRPRGGQVRVVEASRIGVRLAGGQLADPGPDAEAGSQGRVELLSLGVLPGTVQWLPSGDWMILGPDSGTMGGYPVLGVLASGDLDAVAHLWPGDRVMIEVDEGTRGPDPAEPVVVRVRGLG